MGKRFVELGASLVICGWREEVLKQIAGEFNTAFNSRASYHVCNVRDAEAVERMAKAQWKRVPPAAPRTCSRFAA